jgi:hypothetical protein
MSSFADLPLSVIVAAQMVLHLGACLGAIHDDAAAMEAWAAEFVPATVCFLFFCRVWFAHCFLGRGVQHC